MDIEVDTRARLYIAWSLASSGIPFPDPSWMLKRTDNDICGPVSFLRHGKVAFNLSTTYPLDCDLIRLTVDSIICTSECLPEPFSTSSFHKSHNYSEVCVASPQPVVMSRRSSVRSPDAGLEPVLVQICRFWTHGWEGPTVHISGGSLLLHC